MNRDTTTSSTTNNTAEDNNNCNNKSSSSSARQQEQQNQHQQRENESVDICNEDADVIMKREKEKILLRNPSSSPTRQQSPIRRRGRRKQQQQQQRRQAIGGKSTNVNAGESFPRSLPITTGSTATAAATGDDDDNGAGHAGADANTDEGDITSTVDGLSDEKQHLMVQRLRQRAKANRNGNRRQQGRDELMKAKTETMWGRASTTNNNNVEEWITNLFANTSNEVDVDSVEGDIGGGDTRRKIINNVIAATTTAADEEIEYYEYEYDEDSVDSYYDYNYEYENDDEAGSWRNILIRKSIPLAAAGAVANNRNTSREMSMPIPSEGSSGTAATSTTFIDAARSSNNARLIRQQNRRQQLTFRPGAISIDNVDGTNVAVPLTKGSITRSNHSSTNSASTYHGGTVPIEPGAAVVATVTPGGSAGNMNVERHCTSSNDEIGVFPNTNANTNPTTMTITVQHRQQQEDDDQQQENEKQVLSSLLKQKLQKNDLLLCLSFIIVMAVIIVPVVVVVVVVVNYNENTNGLSEFGSSNESTKCLDDIEDNKKIF